MNIAQANRYVKSVTNAVVQSFNFTYKDAKAGKRWRGDVMCRKLLTIFFKGWKVKPSPSLCTNIWANMRVRARWLISYQEINDGHWQHPFLKIVCKYQCLLEQTVNCTGVSTQQCNKPATIKITFDGKGCFSFTA